MIIRYALSFREESLTYRALSVGCLRVRPIKTLQPTSKAYIPPPTSNESLFPDRHR